jgi:hypothetical protein
MSTAREIHAKAPNGALIRFSNNEPRPPERYTRKLRAWERENGIGRLVGRSPASGDFPGTFTLHIGDYGSGGVTLVKMNLVFSTDSTKVFEILDTPKAGTVLVLTGENGHEELRHLAADMAMAEGWLAANHSSGMRTVVVPEPETQAAQEIAPDLASPVDEHYSDRTLKALIAEHGWAATSDHEPFTSVQRSFVGVGFIGGMIVPDGRRNLVAGYARDAARRRYIALSLGDTEIADFDGRDADPADIARQINAAAERYADERRASNGLPSLFTARGEGDAAAPAARAA